MSSVREEVAFLKRVPLFAGVDEKHLNVLAFTGKDREFADGDIIFEHGDEAGSAFLIMEGEAELFNPDGKKPVGGAAANDFLGEQAMLCARPHLVSAKARGRVKALEISRETFFRGITEFPEMGVQVMKVLSDRLDETIGDLMTVHPQLDTGNKLADLTDQDQK